MKTGRDVKRKQRQSAFFHPTVLAVLKMDEPAGSCRFTRFRLWLLSYCLLSISSADTGISLQIHTNKWISSYSFPYFNIFYKRHASGSPLHPPRQRVFSYLTTRASSSPPVWNNPPILWSLMWPHRLAAAHTSLSAPWNQCSAPPWVLLCVALGCKHQPCAAKEREWGDGERKD